MKPPHTLSTLLYCFNERDQVLLLERRKAPNSGLWSPPGGKLRTAMGESPYACACRETLEEIGQAIQPADLHLTGIVSEHGYEGQGHWLMFLFEVKPRLAGVPRDHEEGRFQFHSAPDLERLPMPRTDREQIWPMFWKHRRGFFAAHCRCSINGPDEWTIEESRPVRDKTRNSPHA